MIQFLKARPRDAAALACASERAFHSDIHCGAPGIGGPPGYDSEAWQRKIMRVGDYFKIVSGAQSAGDVQSVGHAQSVGDGKPVTDGHIVGGIIVFRQAPRHYELGRIFVDPDVQNQGIGTQAFEFLWQEYPLAKKWTLGTPAWNRRTRHFYAKVGFVEVGSDGHGGILLERIIAPAGAASEL
jgi:GNAT superfamily N-acetyltransferase